MIINSFLTIWRADSHSNLDHLGVATESGVCSRCPKLLVKVLPGVLLGEKSPGLKVVRSFAANWKKASWELEVLDFSAELWEVDYTGPSSYQQAIISPMYAVPYIHVSGDLKQRIL